MTMELYGLGADKVIIKLLPCLNIQWNRRYLEAGDYEILLRAEDWASTIKYIYCPQRPEVGLVQKTVSERTVKGNFLTVSGFFLEGMFNWKCLSTPYRSYGIIDILMRDLVDRYMADVEVYSKEDATLGTAIYLRPENGTPLGDVMYSALGDQGLSQQIVIEYSSSAFTYHTTKGKDRSMAQTTNGYVLISQNNGTCGESTLETDDSDKRNVCYLSHSDGTGVYVYDNRTFVGGVPTTPLKSIWQDSGMSKEEGESDATFNAELLAEAKRILAEHVASINFDCEMDGARYKYLTDYDLGDICEIRDDPTRRAYTARIIEVNEVYKNGHGTISAQFGDKIPVPYTKKWRR